MDAQARSRGTRGPGRTARDGSSLPAVAVASVAASGSATDSRRRAKAPISDPVTRPMYRTLLLRGLAPAEAANLTAFACGLQVGNTHWTIGEVNRLLFLRSLRRTGRIGGPEPAPEAA